MHICSPPCHLCSLAQSFFAWNEFHASSPPLFLPLPPLKFMLGTSINCPPTVTVVLYAINFASTCKATANTFGKILFRRLHYRARGPIGFLKVKKQKVVIKVDSLKKNYKKNKKNCTCRDDYDQNFAPNFRRDFFRKHIYCQNHGQCSEKGDKGWFFSCFFYHPEKKSSK